eukprot:GGOE01028605.1.p4 GENE.GGOE01028605.1~~GGOE01028605.1.p4  ORF type:complete len:120 (-),score=3.99 GGOE01028605.1:320-679(-)
MPFLSTLDRVLATLGGNTFCWLTCGTLPPSLSWHKQKKTRHCPPKNCRVASSLASPFPQRPLACDAPPSRVPPLDALHLSPCPAVQLSHVLGAAARRIPTAAFPGPLLHRRQALFPRLP